VLAGTFTFTAYGYAREPGRESEEGNFSRRRAYVGIVVGLVIITFPLAVNSTANVLFAI
jgi:hypothetical protein